jgi:Caspase domain
MLRIVLLVGLTLIATLGPVRSDDRRVALVIGVANYRHAPVLANAANDGADMAKALERLGFEVEYLTDADRTAFEAGLRRLGQRARGASASLFYYAGHALELVGRNWLIPSTAEWAARNSSRQRGLPERWSDRPRGSQDRAENRRRGDETILRRTPDNDR